MAYGSVLTDTVQSSTAATAPVFKDGNGTQIGTLCRAWVNFNGTGTVAIRASFNVSSITDNGTGDYTVNFTTALPDANYTPTQMGWLSSGNVVNMYENLINATKTTTAYRVISFNTSGTVQDTSNGYIAVFR